MSAEGKALVLPASIAQDLLEQARAEHPRECLGMLFGQGRQAGRLHPLKNVSPTPERRFLAEPEELLRALQEADGRGEALVALYHSHPHGPDTPSPSDLAEEQYRVPMIIVVPGPAILRAFDLSGQASERDIIVTVAPGASP